jgi:pimeloyl-ACP methyl ester carboxylesterase
MLAPLPSASLPAGVKARFIQGVNGTDMHILEAGAPGPRRPTILLLHGFPELAYSWRKVMPALAEAGYYVVAPDQRGYGRTAATPIQYEEDLSPFRILNLTRDAVALINLLGITSVAAVVGHDFGASIAAACALVRPDLFHSLVIMSAPFTGPPAWPLPQPPEKDAIHATLASLDPPRKHYHAYFATREANADMWHCKQGVNGFLRAYFHFKSGDWPDNNPFELSSWTAEELARMPHYYIMPLALGMAETVAPEAPLPEIISSSHWLTEPELRVYSEDYERTGFQGGLQWYRGRMNGSLAQDLSLFSGLTIDCPALFMAGRRDWGAHQIPGGLQRMRHAVFTRMAPPCVVEGAGHWVQQERADIVCENLLDFFKAAEELSRRGSQ